MKPNSVYVILKVAEVCNIACRYCYFFFHGDMSHEDRPAYLSADGAEAVAEFLLKGVVDLGLEEVFISLHGGEPLMIGKVRFRLLCATLKNKLSGIVKLTIDTQTNAMLVDDDWVDIFREFDIGVGVSLDGPEHINDRHRVDKQARGTHAATLQGLKRLLAAAKAGKGREPAVICVLSPEGCADELFTYFFDEVGVSLVNFRPPIMDWDSYSEHTARKVSSFYDRALSIWLNRNDPSISIVWFREMFASLLSQDNHRMAATRREALFTIRSDGVISPNDGLAAKDPRFRDTGFSVYKTSLIEFLGSELWQEVALSSDLPREECPSCKWASMCRGGDLEERFGHETGLRKRTVYCETRKDVCHNLYEYAIKGISSETLDLRLETRRKLMVNLLH